MAYSSASVRSSTSSLPIGSPSTFVASSATTMVQPNFGNLAQSTTKQMSQSSNGLPLSSNDPLIERQVKLLFEKNTIDKIRLAEQAARKEIEAKRQELRKLVGTRYRDLIYSADSIVEMRNIARDVYERIEQMEDECEVLKKKMKSGGAKTVTQDQVLHRQKYDLAKKIKLLVDTPERIWSALENSNLFKATNLYLQAEAVHSQLHLDKDSTKLIASIPLLSRQWAALGQFPTKIKNSSRNRLLKNGLSVQEYAGALSALVLLDNLSVEKAFEEFLSMRKKALYSVFAAESLSKTKNATAQMSTLIRIVQYTIYHVKAIFYSFNGTENESTPLLISLLSSVPAEAVSAGVPTQWKTVSVDQLRRSTKQWIHNSAPDIRKGGQQILDSVSSSKALAELETLLYKLIRHPFEETSVPVEDIPLNASTVVKQHEKDDLASSTWSSVCDAVVGEDIELWGFLLRDIFIQRGKELLAAPLQQIVVDKYFKSIETEGSIGDFVWQEDPDSEKQMIDITKHKASGTTPAVVSIVDDFDQNLQIALSDLQELSVIPTNKTIPVSKLKASTAEISITTPTKPNDIAELRGYLKQTCFETIRSFVSKVDEIMEQLQPANNKDAVVDKLLSIGRACKAIANGSQKLSTILSLSTQTEAPKQAGLGSRNITRLFRASGESFTVDPMLVQARQMLYKPYYTSHIVWANWVTEQAGNLLKEAIAKDSWTQSYREKSWEELTLKVESEAGEQVEETLRLPFQPSPYVSSFLFSIAQHLHHIGGHTVEKGVVRYLESCLTDKVIDIYSGFDPSLNICREGCVQLLFDLRFEFDILAARSFDDELKEAAKSVKGWKEPMSTQQREAKVEALLLSFQNKLDPIDVAFYEPHLQVYVQKCYQRSTILYGSLTQFKRLYTDVKHKTSMQEQHNVLALAQPVSRFSLLPVSVPTVSSPSNKSESRGLASEALRPTAAAAPISSHEIMPVQGDTSKPLSYMQKLTSLWV